MRALLDSLTVGAGGADAPVRVTGARSWRSLPALYRDHSLFVTASADQAREQIASGARVIGPIGSGTDAGTVRGQLEATRGGRPAALAEVRVWLRDIFAEHATPARLAGILRAADLPGDLVRGRQIAVLATVSDAAEAGRLASALLDQRLRPAEVIAADAGRRRRRRCGRRSASSPTTTSASWSRPSPTTTPASPTAAGASTGRARSPGWPACPGWRRGPPTTLTPRWRPAGLVPARPGLRAGVRAGGRGRVRLGRVRVHALARKAGARQGRPAGPRRPGGRGLGQPRAAAVHDHRLTRIFHRTERHPLAGSRPSALVYGDVDLNLLDGSAIWLQSVTQALVAAGCAVTLVLKAPVRTDRLVAPLRDVEAVTIRSPHAESLLPGLTDASLTVPQAISVLAARRRRRPPRPRRAARPGAGLGGGARRRVRRTALVLPDRRAAGDPRGDAEGGRGPDGHRQGLQVPALPDRGAPLLP